jgi:peptidoglycan hydrolase CwlO-like protein
MDATEAIAVIILIVAIVILVYYYLLNSPSTVNKLRSYVPTSADAHMDEVLGGNPADLTEEAPDVDEESESMTKRIKVKLSDIDMSGLNTDAFSNKIDAFLDAKSDELIKDWSLATTDDLEDLQNKFSETTGNVDALEKDYKEFKKSSEEFQKVTAEKLEDLDKRIESLENN